VDTSAMLEVKSTYKTMLVAGMTQIQIAAIFNPDLHTGKCL